MESNTSMTSSERKGIIVPLTVTLVVQATVSMVAVTVPVLAPSAAPDIGVSSTSVGLYVSIMYIGSMTSSLCCGDFILRYGALRLSQVCLVLCGLGLLLTAWASLPMMIISAFIIGIGYGPVTPSSSHILVRTAPARMMSFVFSLKQTGVPLGGVMAGAVVPALVLSAGWKNASVGIGMFAIGMALLIQPLRGQLDADRQGTRSISFRAAFSPLRLVFSHAPLLHLAIISFLYAGMQLCLLTYLVIYLTRDIGMAFIAAGLTLSAAQMSGTIGRIVWGVLADRYVRPRLMLGLLGIGMAIGSLVLAAVSSNWSMVAVIAVVILFGATAIGWNGVFLAEAARLAPQGQVGAATGGTLCFTFLGVVLGPSLFAAVASTTDSYPMGFVFFAVLTFVGGILAMVSGRRNG